MQRTVDAVLRGRRRRALRALRARADRRRRPLHRQARLRARRAGRDRAQQGRPAQAGAHRDADGRPRRSSATSTRCIRSARRPATASPSCATSSSTLLPGGACLLPARAAHRPAARGADRRAVREKALQLTRDEVPHAIAVEVEELGEQGRCARRSTSRPTRRSRSSSARAGRWSGRSAPAPGRRSSSGSAGLFPRAARQGARPLAPRRVDARAARAVDESAQTRLRRDCGGGRVARPGGAARSFARASRAAGTGEAARAA